MSRVKYELLLILRADIPEKEISQTFEKIKDWVEKEKGKVEAEDLWGRRKLAYKIGSNTEGIYAVWQISLPPAAVRKLEEKLRMSDEVLRFLLTHPAPSGAGHKNL